MHIAFLQSTSKMITYGKIYNDIEISVEKFGETCGATCNIIFSVINQILLLSGMEKK